LGRWLDLFWGKAPGKQGAGHQEPDEIDLSFDLKDFSCPGDPNPDTGQGKHFITRMEMI